MIEVTGSYEMSVPPDVVYLTVGIQSQHKSVKEAQNVVNSKMDRIIESMKGAGLTANEIQTVSYQIQPIYDYQSGQPIFKGITVEHIIKITVQQVGMVGTYIDSAVNNGANIVQGIQYGVKNQQQYYQQALIVAMATAKQKAEVIATNLGCIINPLPVKVIEGGTGTVQPMMAKLASDGTHLMPGLIHIQASVTMTFVVKESF